MTITIDGDFLLLGFFLLIAILNAAQLAISVVENKWGWVTFSFVFILIQVALFCDTLYDIITGV